MQRAMLCVAGSRFARQAHRQRCHTSEKITMSGGVSLPYDEKPMRAFTSYSYSEMRRFRRIHAAGMRRVFMLLILLYLGMALFVTFQRPFTVSLALLWGILVVLAAVWLAISGLLYTRAQYARDSAGATNGAEFVFRNYDYSVTAGPKKAAKSTKHYYVQLHKVVDAPGLFCLYFDKAQVQLVSKQGFTAGTPDELRALLKNQLPPRAYRTMRSLWP